MSDDSSDDETLSAAERGRRKNAYMDEAPTHAPSRRLRPWSALGLASATHHTVSAEHIAENKVLVCSSCPPPRAPA
jgi:hypothetical protein